MKNHLLENLQQKKKEFTPDIQQTSFASFESFICKQKLLFDCFEPSKMLTQLLCNKKTNQKINKMMFIFCHDKFSTDFVNYIARKVEILNKKMATPQFKKYRKYYNYIFKNCLKAVFLGFLVSK